MKIFLKWTSRLIFALTIAVLLFVVGYYSYFKWGQNQKYPDRVTIVAYYMQYACGDCSLDMKVQRIDNKKYQFIVDRDVFPKPGTKLSYELCSFIADMNMRYQSGIDSSMKSFTIIGKLHKYPHAMPIFNCSETPYFTVEKIKYGNDKWHNF